MTEFSSVQWEDVWREFGVQAYRHASPTGGYYCVYHDEDSPSGFIYCEYAVDPEHFGTIHSRVVGKFHDFESAMDAAIFDELN